MEVLPVVLASDRNYLPFVYTTMYSVLENRKNKYKLFFLIMVPEGTQRVDYDRNWQFSEYKIEYIEIPDNYFGKLKMTIEHITMPTYYRLLIPEYLKDYDKCIYLDVDLLICDDICELIKTDLSGLYLAAGLGISLTSTKESEKQLAEYLNIPSAENYFNAGVLVINLKYMRENNMTERFLLTSKKEWVCQDQDVLNICCYGKVKIFPMRYNIYSIGYGLNSDIKKHILIKGLEEALNDPCIIHYAAHIAKPWKNINAVKGKEWWELAKNALPDPIYQYWLHKAKKDTVKIRIPDVFLKFEKYLKVVIFGIGKEGKKLFSFLEIIGREKIVAFFDNNFQGETFKGIEVQCPSSKYVQDSLIIISCQKEQDKIFQQLLNLGYQKENIVNYLSGDIEAWYSLDERYRITKQEYEGL